MEGVYKNIKEVEEIPFFEDDENEEQGIYKKRGLAIMKQKSKEVEKMKDIEVIEVEESGADAFLEGLIGGIDFVSFLCTKILSMIWTILGLSMKLFGQIIIFVLGLLSFVLSGLIECTKTKKQDKEIRRGREIEVRQKRTFVRVEVEFFD